MSVHEPHHANGSHHTNGSHEADMFDLGGFVQIITGAVRHHKVIVLTTCALTLFAATAYVLIWPATYRVEAQIAAERELDPSRDTFYANWQVFRKADARDEVVLFTSGPVLREVIERNNLTYDDVYHPFLKHASYLWQTSWLGERYKALKNWIVPNPDAATPEEEDFGRTLEGLKAGIRIAGEQDSHIATITVRAPTPAAADIANSLIDSYLDYRAEQYAAEARTAFNVLSEESERARVELDSVIARREAFAAEHGLLVDFQKETQDVRELTLVETRAADLRSQLSALQASLRAVEAQLAVEPPRQVLSAVRELNPVRENAKLRHLQVRTSLIDLRARYRADSPEVVNAEAELAELETLIAEEPEHIDRSVTEGVNTNYQELTASRDQLRSEAQGVEARLRSTEATADDLRERLTTLPAIIEASTNLNREYGLASERYQRLLLRRMEAEVSATAVDAAPASVRVVDYAAPPSGKSWPRLKILYPLALFMGLGLGMLAAVLRSLTAGRLLRTHMAQGRVGGPVYATIALGSGAPPLVAFAPLEQTPALSGADAPALHARVDDHE